MGLKPAIPSDVVLSSPRHAPEQSIKRIFSLTEYKKHCVMCVRHARHAITKVHIPSGT